MRAGSSVDFFYFLFESSTHTSTHEHVGAVHMLMIKIILYLISVVLFAERKKWNAFRFSKHMTFVLLSPQKAET